MAVICQVKCRDFSFAFFSSIICLSPHPSHPAPPPLEFRLRTPKEMYYQPRPEVIVTGFPRTQRSESLLCWVGLFLSLNTSAWCYRNISPTPKEHARPNPHTLNIPTSISSPRPNSPLQNLVNFNLRRLSRLCLCWALDRKTPLLSRKKAKPLKAWLERDQEGQVERKSSTKHIPLGVCVKCKQVEWRHVQFCVRWFCHPVSDSDIGICLTMGKGYTKIISSEFEGSLEPSKKALRASRWLF